MARILSQYETERSIIYCAFAAEEVGLYGSETYATRCNQQGMEILGYFNIDMTGYLESGDPLRLNLLYPSTALPLANYVVNIHDVYFKDILPIMIYPNHYLNGFSDHKSFNNKGFYGIWTFEHPEYDHPYIHTTNDKIGPSVNNFEQCHVFTQVNLTAIATLAGLIYEPPILPLADFEATTETTIVEGSTVQFTDLSTNNPTDWKWYFYGGTPDEFVGQNPPEILYENPGVYDVKLVVSNGAGSNELTREKYITVTMKPPVSDFEADVTEIEEGEYVTFTHLAIQNPQSFNWIFEGGDPPQSDQETPPVILYETAGTYSVSLTVTNEGGESTKQEDNYIIVKPKTAIAEQGIASKIVVYPNPTDGVIQVSLPNPSEGGAYKAPEEITIEFFDVLGRRMGIAHPPLRGGLGGLDISHLPTGIYFLRIQTETDVITQKVVKM